MFQKQRPQTPRPNPIQHENIACLNDVVLRHEHKNGIEYLKKAQVYLNLAIEKMESEK